MGFKPGQSGNPGGKKPMTEEERIVRKLTKETFNELAQLMMTKNFKEIGQLVIDPAISMEVRIYLKHVIALDSTPNWAEYERYLSRRIGKVVEEVEVKLPKPTIIQLSGEKQIILGREIKEDE